MSIRIGDSVFIRNGTPAVVKDRDELSGNLTLDTDQAEMQNAVRHGFINGLSQQDRDDFNAVLDEVKDESLDPAQRVETLKEKLAEIETDPSRHMLATYVRSEMMHIMNSHGIRPREYSIHESKTR